jgi:hypothetical protein
MDPRLSELSELLGSTRAGQRLRAMDAASAKPGGQIVRLIDDRGVIPMLIRGLADGDRRVQRAAARGLRPWLADEPALLDEILAAYAAHSFDGSYSHAGLYDTDSGAIWVPRYAAVRGHAALLPDANADRYFRFNFYVPGQAPGWIPSREGTGHLVLIFVPEWSYTRQQLIAAHDERRLNASRREQQRYAAAICAFYGGSALPYAARVHEIEGGGGHVRARRLDVVRIEAGGRALSSDRG